MYMPVGQPNRAHVSWKVCILLGSGNAGRGNQRPILPDVKSRQWRGNIWLFRLHSPCVFYISIIQSSEVVRLLSGHHVGTTIERKPNGAVPYYKG